MQQFWIGWQVPGKPFEWLGFGATGNWAHRWAEAAAKTVLDPAIRVWIWSNGQFVQSYEGGTARLTLQHPVLAQY